MGNVDSTERGKGTRVELEDLGNVREMKKRIREVVKENGSA